MVVTIKRIKINKYNDVDLLELLTDYRNNFHGKKCKIETNYKKLNQFIVSFYDDGFPHLLGLHYTLKPNYAKAILKAIENKSISANSIQKTEGFKKYHLRDRIVQYHFLYDVFYDKKIKVCIPTDNIKCDWLKLSCVFTDKRDKRELILGLKKDDRTSEYKPATLHIRKGTYYSDMKCSKIKSIEWIDVKK